MKKKIQLTGAIFLSLFIVIGCYKEDAQTSNSSKKQSALTNLFKNIAPPKQNFTVTAGQQQVVTGEKGTKVTFFATSFKKKDGTILTSGNVKIVLQEMLTGQAMILANKTTTSNGKLLQSGGQIYLNAYLNGEALEVNQLAKPKVMIPTTPNSAPMDLYIGSVKESDSVAGDTTINWDIKEKDTVGKSADSSSGAWVNYYYYNIYSFGFSNCDALYHYTSSKTDIIVTTPSGYVDSNCNVFAYFPIINGVTSLGGNSTTNIFKIGYDMAPEGLDVKLVLVARKNNKYYYEIKTTIVTAGMTIAMTNPIEATETQIAIAIKSM
jgi:hypothetical protein